MKSNAKAESAKKLRRHIASLKACRLCSGMCSTPVSGGAILSRILLVGQAPGGKEPQLGRPFAWTAGKTLFGWFENSCGLNEENFRKKIYMAAACRCFPGKKPSGGDRVPSRKEIDNCSRWLQGEFEILQPALVIPVGKSAIELFIEYRGMSELVGRSWSCQYAGHKFEAIPLPHPSGASPWPKMEPGKALLRKALGKIAKHPAMRALKTN